MRINEMTYKETMAEINDRREEMMTIRKSIRELQASVEPEEVSDYSFSTTDSDVTLSALFGDKDTLFMIHNMGKGCVHCTQWADGFNGVIEHLEDRAAFVVSSPNTPDVQRELARSRGWKFKMVSHAGTTFAEDMGYFKEYEGKVGFWPGVSVFKKVGDKIVRVSDTNFGPGDDFNAVLNLFELLPEGSVGWEPKFSYH